MGFLIFVGIFAFLSSLQINAGQMLNSYPMIMSHDAATGEIIPERDHIVADWSMTQNTSLVEQLNCGSRSFDYRPYLYKNVVFAHHGGFKIYKPMEETVMEVMKWCHEHSDDLIIFYISHYDGDSGCETAAKALFDRLKIKTIQDCGDLSSLSYTEAKVQAALPGGGSLLAIFDCTDEYYDSTINCYGNDFVCYNDSWPQNTSYIPFDHMTSYLQNTTNTDPTSHSVNMWMTQAHWQSSAETVILGTLHNSSLLLDESRSNMNKWIESAIYSKSFKYLNFLELDHVCDNGPAIYEAIKRVYLS